MALFTFGLYALHRKREVVAVLALFLAFMVRSDTIAFLGILAVLFVLFRQISLGAFGAFIAAAIAYSFLSNGAGHPGWWTHFWFSNVAQQLTMEGFHPEFSIAVYLKALASGLVRCVTELAWPGMLVILVAAWAFIRSIAWENGRARRDHLPRPCRRHHRPLHPVPAAGRAGAWRVSDAAVPAASALHQDAALRLETRARRVNCAQCRKWALPKSFGNNNVRAIN